MRALLALPLLAAAVAADHLTVCIIGDWGGQDSPPYYEVGQMAAAKAMAEAGADCDFALALGDNFYSSGIHSDEFDARFSETFESVYTNDIDFQVVAGNHDWKNNVSAQIAYTHDSERWEFPDYYYSFTKSFVHDGETYTAEFVMIDTVILSGATDAERGTAEYWAKPPGPADESAAQQQLDWLEATLEASTADFIIVGGHYPIYSACSHGSTSELVADVLPLLEKYGAHYFSGHDHCQFHIKDDASTVQHILIGNSDNCCYDADNWDEVPDDSVKFYVANDNHGKIIGGFGVMEIHHDGAEVAFYNAKLGSSYEKSYDTGRVLTPAARSA